MKYEINMIFREDEDYKNKALFCGENGLRIVELTPDEHGRRFQIQKVPEMSKEETICYLRQRREHECFSVINRGQLWFSMLAEYQILELKAWYRAWLDVTETLIVPDKPTWLK